MLKSQEVKSGKGQVGRFAGRQVCKWVGLQVAGLQVVVLNWNAGAETVECVRRVAGWERLRPRIIVVDNGSADGSADLIARECPGVHLIRNRRNLGFAGGNNRGIEAALAAGDDPILLLNSDALIAEEDVARLRATLEADETIGFVGPLLFDADRSHLLAAGGRDPSLHHLSHLDAPPCDGPVCTVGYVPGTVLLARAEVFRTVGPLEEGYFFSMEVADLCLRAARRGYRSVVETRARAYHALDMRPSDLRRTLYVYYIIRNRFLLCRRVHPAWWPALYAFWTVYSVAIGLKEYLGGHPETARAVYRGLGDGLRGRFGPAAEPMAGRPKR